jgi:hypothetical protein
MQFVISHLDLFFWFVSCSDCATVSNRASTLDLMQQEAQTALKADLAAQLDPRRQSPISDFHFARANATLQSYATTIVPRAAAVNAWRCAQALAAASDSTHFSMPLMNLLTLPVSVRFAPHVVAQFHPRIRSPHADSQYEHSALSSACESVPSFFLNAVQLPAQRLDVSRASLETYACITPKVLSPVVEIAANAQDSHGLLDVSASETTLSHLSDASSDFRPLAVRQQLHFPDKRLVQVCLFFRFSINLFFLIF